mmetsp:Transcript_80487/g.260176  ORF Transcript_80487/g.260176 Transcript_80487/m.260176 type:complete len:230 (-) Transcript_80487:437-1126(-)
MASLADRLRVLPALCGLERRGPKDCQALCGPELYAETAGAVRLRGPSRARLPQDDPAPHLRQVHGPPLVHPPGHPARLLQGHLRVRDAQRCGRVARNLGQHHQRLRAPFEGRAQRLPHEGLDPAAQGQVVGLFLSAVVVLHGPVRREGPPPGLRHHHLHAPLLAGVDHLQAGAFPERARGDFGAHAALRVPQNAGRALPSPRTLHHVPPLPGGRANALFLEQRLHREAD